MSDLKQIIVSLLLLLSFSCASEAKTIDMIYLMPEGFTGGVIVLYDEVNGVTPELLKDDSLVYRIPKDGFLKVKPSINPGPYKLRYFYVDEKDNRKEIEYINPKSHVNERDDTTTRSLSTITEDETNNKIFAMHHQRQVFEPNGKWMALYIFFIGKPKDSGIAYIRTLDRVDEIEKEIVKGMNNQTKPH
jgi:hypothetical protein